MQVQLNNGTILDVLTVNGGSRYYQNSNRDSLEIQLEKNKYSLGELDALTAKPSNLERILLLDGDARHLHEHYTLRTELSVRSVELTVEDPTIPKVTEERVCIVLAQKTYAEFTLESLLETVDALVLTAL